MQDTPYIHPVRIGLHDTDAAGVLFYGHLFRHVHDAYEAFMEHLGFPLQDLIRGHGATPRLPLPIIRAEATYERPLRQGDRVLIELRVAEVRRRSFAIDYRLVDDQGRLYAAVRTVHCVASDHDDQELALPSELHHALSVWHRV